MVTYKMKEFVNQLKEIYKDRSHTLPKWRKVRGFLLEYLTQEVPGIKYDDQTQEILVLNKIIGDLNEMTNQIVKFYGHDKKIYSLLNKFTNELRIQKQALVHKPMIDEVVFLKAQMQNKIKVLFEGDELFIFFEDENLLKQYEAAIISTMTASVGFIKPKKISSIGMIKGKFNEEYKNNIESAIKAVLGDTIEDFTIISEDEYLIHLKSNKDEM